MCFSEHEGEKAAGTPAVAQPISKGARPDVDHVRHTDDYAFAGQLLCEIDLVAR